MVEESCFDDLDRSFLNGSSRMADFFCWTYGWLGYRLVAPIDPTKFDNSTSKIAEVGTRILIALGALATICFAGTYVLLTAVVLGVGSKIFRSIGFALQKEGFTHIRGSASEKSLVNGEAKVMTWNVRGHGGGLHYDHGGVIHWRSRVDQIAKDIKTEDPDVIVLQEIYDTALVESLVEKLRGQYAHFYTHLGANTWGNVSGCMVITKCAVHRFSHTEFSNNDWKVNRGFETLEIKASPDPDAPPCLRIVGTQLTPGKEAKEKRVDQVSQIVNKLAKEKLTLPTLFVGSLNMNRDDPEEGAFLSNYLYHSYLDKDPTHSDQLVSQWAPIFDGQEESSDFISFFRRNIGEGRFLPVIERDIRLIHCHLLKGFEINPNTNKPDTTKARTDHHAVVTEVDGLRPAMIDG